MYCVSEFIGHNFTSTQCYCSSFTCSSSLERSNLEQSVFRCYSGSCLWALFSWSHWCPGLFLKYSISLLLSLSHTILSLHCLTHSQKYRKGCSLSVIDLHRCLVFGTCSFFLFFFYFGLFSVTLCDLSSLHCAHTHDKVVLLIK